MSGFPLVQPIAWQEPIDIFNRIAEQDGAIFLDSAVFNASTGRYSFIAYDPFLIFRSKNNQVFINNHVCIGNPWELLKEQLALYSLPALADLPPFQGGAAGFFSYDLVQHLEKIPLHHYQNTTDDMYLGFYDIVLAFDHHHKSAYLFSSGFPEQNMTARENRANFRMKQALDFIDKKNKLSVKKTFFENNIINSNFSEADYQQAVQKVINYILEGDIFQANIAQRFCAEVENLNAWELYKQLRMKNPAPFSAYMNMGELILASSSPGRFLKLNQKKVITCPIKGTRPRSNDLEKDKAFAQELLNSEKDRAENIMIVDLLRNDLSKVCLEHSVIVAKLCELQSFSNVYHLVSTIEGLLKPIYNAIDLLCATFPGGSITGAPKVRAMEIIAEIEPHARGPYCGSIGYINFNGDMDTSIIIRTFVIHKNEVSFHAGGGVIADSQPKKEWDESMVKASGLYNTLSGK